MILVMKEPLGMKKLCKESRKIDPKFDRWVGGRSFALGGIAQAKEDG